MFSFSFVIVFIFLAMSIESKITKGFQPVLQKTVEALFFHRSQVTYPGTCKLLRSSPRQTKMCKNSPGFVKSLTTAKKQAINACEEAFQYDRWNCSLVFNKRAGKSVFNNIYRETAFVYGLIGASITHAVAKGCASGDLIRCSCKGKFGKNKSLQWKMSGCGDDFKYGNKITRNFLDFKHAGIDQIAEILKQDVVVGIDSIGEQLKEVCKCHGFSGSCTTKTCWKRLGPFNSAMGLLKKHYHHAIKKKIINYTSKRAISSKVRRKMKVERNNLVYLQKSPNLCVGTKGRECKNKDNCATLCCGRGYVTDQRPVSSRCRCKMVGCCAVQCDTCVQQVDFYTCK